MPPPDIQRLLQTGISFSRAGKSDQAEVALRAALQHAPGHPEILGHLAAALQQRGKVDEALACADQALKASPNHGGLHFLRGNILVALKQYANAVPSLELASRADPRSTDKLVALGFARLQSGDEAGAGATWQQALAVNPNDAVVHSNLAAWMLRNGRAEESVAHCRRAVELQPKLIGAHGNLANTLSQLGRMEEAIAAYRSGWALDPGSQLMLGGLIFALHYRAADAAQLRAPIEAWARAQRPAPAAPFTQTRDPGRPLRIGYLSPDFCAHAVSFFFEPLLANHDRAAFEIFCYSGVERPDFMTDKLRGLASAWRSTIGAPAAAVAAQIRADGIDILVDLALHSAGNRLDVIAQRPAPIQASYLGYPSTTGLKAVDYVLLDRQLALEGHAEALCVEKIWRLDGSYFCFRAPPDSPPVAPQPAPRNGHITFGSFNNFAKISPDALAAWGRAVAAVPGSKILLQAKAFRDSSARRYIETGLAAQGVAADRIEFRVHSPLNAYLAAISDVDIALDAFPYNGGTTTCHALWMGVPVVTLAGQLPISRMGLSVLTHAGMPELVAHTPDGFVEKVAALAGDAAALAARRAQMRDRLAASALMDEAGSTRGLERAYRAMWRIWCDAGAAAAT